MLPLLDSCVGNVLSLFGVQQTPAQSDSEKQLAIRRREQAKFVKLGFPQEISEKYPECVHFLLESGAAFATATFKNSTKTGPDNHGIRLDSDGHPLIRMENEWRRWEHVQASLEFDKDLNQIVSKGNPALKWNYISPDGIVQKGGYEYDEIYPVEQLDEEEYKSLLAHSQKAWDSLPEVDPGEEKECILQIATTDNTPQERDWLNNNLHNNMAGHTWVRIIDKEGKVYSFGFLFPADQGRIITRNPPFNNLISGKTNIATYDYEETRSFQARRVTSIPMTAARKEQILAAVTAWNKEGIRFNYVHQNCTKFTTIVLGMAGIHVKTRITFAQFLARNLPDLPPAIKKVQEAVASVFETIGSYLPEPVLHVFSLVTEVTTFIPRKIWTFLSNLLVIGLGGAQATFSLPEEKIDHLKMEDDRLIDFQSLIRSPLDMFEDEKSDSYHSAVLVDWQKKQSSTITYSYQGPKMYMLPEQI